MADNPYTAAGLKAGLPPALAAYMPRYVHIESGGNPNAQTGSYTGVLQMGPDERAKYGGNGLDQGAAMYADKYNWFAQKYGRDPSPTELYMINQQGQGGVAAHMANPQGAAWQNMYSTAEGQQKGQGWAKQAIWGNVPDDVKAQFPGGVDTMTSQDFMNMWQRKVEQGQAQPFSPVGAQQAPGPTWSPVGGAQAQGATAQPPAGGPMGGLLGSILPPSVASAVSSMATPPQQGLIPSALSMAGVPSSVTGMFGGGQPAATSSDPLMTPEQAARTPGSGSYMPDMPQAQQLQAPQINYYRPQQLAGMQQQRPQPRRF